jgi:hypothetical protein
MIDNFDSSEADSIYDLNVEGGLSSITLSDNTTDVMEGSGSLNCKAVIGEYHPWGSFAQLIYRDTADVVQDWSISDSLSIWIKVNVPPTNPGEMVFRFHIADRPSPEDPLEEYIYENLSVLDYQHGWFKLLVPLTEREQSTGAIVPDSTGFILPPDDWGFTTNNGVLDRDKIVGYNIGMITTGWNPNPNIPADSLEVQYDAFERFGTRAVPFLIFNGLSFDSGVQIPGWGGAWGQSTIGIEEGAGPEANTNAIKWVQGDEWGEGWTGFVLESIPAFNLAGAWTKDTLQFKMKAESGVGELRFQFTDGTAGGKRGWNFTPIDDNQWHTYKVALQDLIFPPGEDPANYGPIDSSAITSIEMMAEASGIPGKVIYITDWWTGNPDFDVIAPAVPTDLLATPGPANEYYNLITWSDVPGESNETYTIYYSTNEITDVDAAGVEVVATRIPENEEQSNHLLRWPVTDQNVSYYYAIICKDEAGNKSDVSANTPLTTNLAEGVTVINPTAPTNFAADGDLSDWVNSGIAPFRMFKSEGNGYEPPNLPVDDDDDLSVLAYVAMDNDYLYVAYDVTDNIVNPWAHPDNSWENDAADLFIGLYNWHGAPHSSLRTGDESEPDYQFRFSKNEVTIDNAGQHVMFDSTDANYYWEEKFDPGYIVEAKISFADIAAVNSDNLFTPLVGMRIPIDIAVHDADLSTREGMLTYSINNEDQSHLDVSRWQYTWIGDQATDVEGDDNVVLTYELAQNYPNPFNPATQIRYTLEQSSNVTLRVYDMLGREVASLVNENQNAGRHVVDFNASSFASGVYLYRLEAGSFIQVKKMILMK